ncbi:hypothetical protein [Aliarcobacter lanthieri]|uniref:hypothetical protein n=1 Tax=Aliarcobacter lanthieri TaxID=1355374 RepID=UPI000479261F|nr:hypothetical protein [Aliarcobacter lanthieri]QKF59222.1 hypothetical protein ALANTH_1113 [Aliarcobacter lanthieri]
MEKLQNFIENNSPLFLFDFYGALSLGLEEENIKQEIWKKVEGMTEMEIFEHFFNSSTLEDEPGCTDEDIERISDFGEEYFGGKQWE